MIRNRILYLLPLLLATGACASEESAVVETPEAAEMEMEMEAAPATETRNIVQVATEAGSFNTLVAAIQAAGLVEVLQGEGPFTVFAPTDEAFAKLPAGTVEALVADPERLATILTYHVVPGRVMSADLVASGGGSPATVQGDTVRIVVAGSAVTVNDATVVTADVPASNGVIHAIDTVLMPAAAN